MLPVLHSTVALNSVICNCMTTSFGGHSEGQTLRVGAWPPGHPIEPPLSLAAWRVALHEDARIFLIQHQDGKILPSILVYLQYTHGHHQSLF